MTSLRRHEAREQVVQAVLRLLTAEHVPLPDPRERVRQAAALCDQLELAARNLTRSVDRSEPQSWPDHWAHN